MSRFGWIRPSRERQVARQYIDSLGIKAWSTEQPVGQLSGGNQQKVVIAKWLYRDCDILIFDEPTRGIDVGAKFEIYTIIAELAQQGKSIVMITSEMPELLGMSDRIMVMCEGRVSGFLEGIRASQEEIMRLAAQFM